MPKIDYAREANRIAKKIVYDATRDPVDEIMKDLYKLQNENYATKPKRQTAQKANDSLYVSVQKGT